MQFVTLEEYRAGKETDLRFSSVEDYRESAGLRLLEGVNNIVEVSQEQLAEISLDYFAVALRKPRMASWLDFKGRALAEGTEASRYAVEVNYRTSMKDAEEGFAKICLGYISAAMKAAGYHIKMVFTEKPMRILVSTRNWDDGEWVGMVTYNHDLNVFVISKGFFNKERRTVSVQSSCKAKGDTAAGVSDEMRNVMHSLKNTPDKHQEKLKPVPLKRGPKT